MINELFVWAAYAVTIFTQLGFWLFIFNAHSRLMHQDNLYKNMKEER